jgi:hypothetical protein
MTFPLEIWVINPEDPVHQPPYCRMVNNCEELVKIITDGYRVEKYYI